MSVSRVLKQPTGEQCNKNELVYRDEHSVGYAIWYPQMGGYVGCAIAIFDKKWKDYGVGSDGGCIDVAVWHDGDFPFADDCNREPTILHHCSGDQFIEFGKKINELNEKGRVIV